MSRDCGHLKALKCNFENCFIELIKREPLKKPPPKDTYLLSSFIYFPQLLKVGAMAYLPIKDFLGLFRYTSQSSYPNDHIQMRHLENRPAVCITNTFGTICKC